MHRKRQGQLKIRVQLLHFTCITATAIRFVTRFPNFNTVLHGFCIYRSIGSSQILKYGQEHDVAMPTNPSCKATPCSSLLVGGAKHFTYE